MTSIVQFLNTLQRTRSLYQKMNKKVKNLQFFVCFTPKLPFMWNLSKTCRNHQLFAFVYHFLVTMISSF